jgi:two-component system, OmpR family, torCAD operon response regulator TorR
METSADILLVEDDASTQALLAAFLKREGFKVTPCGTAKEAHSLLSTSTYQLMLLDMELPDEDGMVVARQVRTKSSIPIIFVTSRSSSLDKIHGLDIGADDYITKPFEPDELVARIKSVLRRYNGGQPPKDNSILYFGYFRMDLARRQVWGTNGDEIHLTRGEFDVLLSLINADGRVLTRAQLLDALSSQHDAFDRTIDVIISRLRKKMEVDRGSSSLIATVPGLGYRLNAVCKR